MDKASTGQVQAMPRSLSLGNVSDCGPKLLGMVLAGPILVDAGSSPVNTALHTEKHSEILPLGQVCLLSENSGVSPQSQETRLKPCDKLLELHTDTLRQPKIRQKETKQSLESAKTPDSSLMVVSAKPPFLERVVLEDTRQLNEQDESDDDGTKPLPKLEREIVLPTASILTAVQKTAQSPTNLHARENDLLFDASPVSLLAVKDSASNLSCVASGMQKVLPKKPIVLLTRLSPDILDKCRSPTVESKSRRNGREYGHNGSSHDSYLLKQAQRTGGRSRKEVNVSFLSDTVEEAGELENSAKAVKKPLDVNSNQNHPLDTCLLVDPRVASMSRTLHLACSRGKAADQIAFKTRRPAIVRPQLLGRRPGLPLTNCKNTHNKKLHMISKHLKMRETSVTRKRSSALTLSSTVRDKSLCSQFKKGVSGAPVQRDSCCFTEPSVAGWERCPEVIFDCALLSQRKMIMEDDDVADISPTDRQKTNHQEQNLADVKVLAAARKSVATLPSSLTDSRISCLTQAGTEIFNSQVVRPVITADFLLHSPPQVSSHSQAAESSTSTVSSSHSLKHSALVAAENDMFQPNLQASPAKILAGCQKQIAQEPGTVQIADTSRQWMGTGSELCGSEHLRTKSTMSTPRETGMPPILQTNRPLSGNSYSATQSATRTLLKPTEDIPVSSSCLERTAAGVKSGLSDDVITQTFQTDIAAFKHYNSDHNLSNLPCQPSPTERRAQNQSPSLISAATQLDIYIPRDNRTLPQSDNVSRDPDIGCEITCIEKTSPAFVIPHQEEKVRIESDLVVMQNHYYSRMNSSSKSSSALVSGCCHDTDQHHGENGLVGSAPAAEARDLLLPVTENVHLYKSGDCLSNQSHLANTGILMINAGATSCKYDPSKVSPGRQRINFRSMSEDSDLKTCDQFRDIELSTVVVKADCLCKLNHDFGGPDGSEDVPQFVPSGMLSRPYVEEQMSTSEQHLEKDSQEDAGDYLVLQASNEEVLLQNFEDHTEGELKISLEEHGETDEVFQIVSEVPILHKAYQPSVYCMADICLSSELTADLNQKQVLDKNDGGYGAESDDSDATLPYPRDERMNKTRTARRTRTDCSKKWQEGKRPREKKVSVPQSPITHSIVGGKKSRQKSVCLDPPPVVRPERKKKSTQRHPLFKKRSQEAGRRPRSKSKISEGNSRRPLLDSKPPDCTAIHPFSVSTPPSVLLEAASFSLSVKLTESDSSSNSSSEGVCKSPFNSKCPLKAGSPLNAKTLNPQNPPNVVSPLKAKRLQSSSPTGKQSTTSASSVRSKRNTVAIETVPKRSASKVKRAPNSRRKDAGAASCANKGKKDKPTATSLTDEDSESDELPRILPPKRRRLPAGRRLTSSGAAEKAASSAAAAEVTLAVQESLADAYGSERIMREFPRHNWLQHKILQKTAYTPPCVGISTLLLAGNPMEAADMRGGNCRSIKERKSLSQPETDTGESSLAIVTASEVHRAQDLPLYGSDIQSLGSSTVSRSATVTSPVISSSGLPGKDDDLVYGDNPLNINTVRSVPAPIWGTGAAAINLNISPVQASISVPQTSDNGNIPGGLLACKPVSSVVDVAGTFTSPVTLIVQSPQISFIPVLPQMPCIPRLLPVPQVSSLPQEPLAQPVRRLKYLQPKKSSAAHSYDSSSPLLLDPSSNNIRAKGVRRPDMSTKSRKQLKQTVKETDSCNSNERPELLSVDQALDAVTSEPASDQDGFKVSSTPAASDQAVFSVASMLAVDQVADRVTCTPTGDQAGVKVTSTSSGDQGGCQEKGETAASIVPTCPQYQIPSPLQRCRSCGALPTSCIRETQKACCHAASEADNGWTACASRRRSWEQDKTTSRQEDEIEITLIQQPERGLSLRSAAEARASTSVSTTSAIITTSTSRASTVTLATSVSPASQQEATSAAVLKSPKPSIPVLVPLDLIPQPIPSQALVACRPRATLGPPPSLIPNGQLAKPGSTGFELGQHSTAGEDRSNVETSATSLDSGTPLDLCVKKADILGSSRVRGNPPVQLVLPQVQPRTFTTTITTFSPSCSSSSSDVIADTKRVLKAFSVTTASSSSRDEATPCITGSSAARHMDILQMNQLSTSQTLPCLVPAHHADKTAVAETGRDGRVAVEVSGRAFQESVSAGTAQHEDTTASLVMATAIGGQVRGDISMGLPVTGRQVCAGSPGSEEEERLREQLRALQELAARKEQEREELLMLHKRKAEMLEEMEAKRSRITTSSTSAPDAGVVHLVSSSSSNEDACSHAAPADRVAGSLADTAARGSDRELTVGQLMSALYSLPRENSSSPKARKSAAELNALDLTWSASAEPSSSAENRRPLVHLINQALQELSGKHPSRQADNTVAEAGSRECGQNQGKIRAIRSAHQVPKDSCNQLMNLEPSAYPNQLFSPYTWRRKPLNEPPVLRIKQSLERAPRSAHCQPPFQPAGSLIVPALSAGAPEQRDKPDSRTRSQAADGQTVVSGERTERRDSSAESRHSQAQPADQNVTRLGDRDLIDLTKEQEEGHRLEEPRAAFVADCAGPVEGNSKNADHAEISRSAVRGRSGMENDMISKQLLSVQPTGVRVLPVTFIDCLPSQSPNARCSPAALVSKARFPAHCNLQSTGPTVVHSLQQQQQQNMSTEIHAMQHRSSRVTPFQNFTRYVEQHDAAHSMMLNAAVPYHRDLGVQRLPGSKLVQRESAVQDMPPFPCQQPLVSQFAVRNIPAVEDLSLVLRNPMEETPGQSQPARMIPIIPKPVDGLSVAIRQHRQFLGQSAITEGVRLQQESGIHMQQPQPSFLVSQSLQQPFPQQLPQQSMTGHSRGLPAPLHHPHSGLPHPVVSSGAAANLSSESRALQLSVPLGGMVSASSTCTSPYYNLNLGVSAREYIPPAQHSGHSLMSPGQGRRSQDMVQQLSSMPQIHAGGRPPYFPSSGLTHIGEAPKVSRVSGAYPPVSQPYPSAMVPCSQQQPVVSFSHHKPAATGPGATHLPQTLQQHSLQHPQQYHVQQQATRKQEGVCQLCGMSAKFICSLCRAVWYCSHRCQTVHWASHVTQCKAKT